MDTAHPKVDWEHLQFLADPAITVLPTKATDSAGDADLTYDDDASHRAFEGIAAAVPYGGAPEFKHSSGAGMIGTLPTIGAEWTLAGFLRAAAPLVPPLLPGRALVAVSLFDCGGGRRRHRPEHQRRDSGVRCCRSRLPKLFRHANSIERR